MDEGELSRERVGGREEGGVPYLWKCWWGQIRAVKRMDCQSIHCFVNGFVDIGSLRGGGRPIFKKGDVGMNT